MISKIIISRVRGQVIFLKAAIRINIYIYSYITGTLILRMPHTSHYKKISNHFLKIAMICSRDLKFVRDYLLFL